MRPLCRSRPRPKQERVREANAHAMKWRRYATVAKAPNKGETGLDAEAKVGDDGAGAESKA